MKTAVLIPAYNEEKTIQKVYDDFRRELPEADIYIYNNNSTDKTLEIANALEGAIVRNEYRQGKGFVMRSMFSQIDADIYVLVDADDTYPAQAVHQLIEPILTRNADMVVGDRLSNGTYTSENKRPMHDFGNSLVKNSINFLFKSDIADVMSGYRAFSRKFIKNYPVMSKGFEVETELTLHALDKRFLIEQVPITYRDRPDGSFSKLNTVSDGILVLRTLVKVFRNYRPMLFFGIISAVFALLGIAFGMPAILDYIREAFVYHVPFAILASSLEVIALLSLSCGLILDTITYADKRNYELNILHYEERAHK